MELVVKKAKVILTGGRSWKIVHERKWQMVLVCAKTWQYVECWRVLLLMWLQCWGDSESRGRRDGTSWRSLWLCWNSDRCSRCRQHVNARWASDA